jgi:hypothetical protein
VCWHHPLSQQRSLHRHRKQPCTVGDPTHTAVVLACRSTAHAHASSRTAVARTAKHHVRFNLWIRHMLRTCSKRESHDGTDSCQALRASVQHAQSCTVPAGTCQAVLHDAHSTRQWNNKQHTCDCKSSAYRCVKSSLTSHPSFIESPPDMPTSWLTYTTSGRAGRLLTAELLNTQQLPLHTASTVLKSTSGAASLPQQT